MAEPSVGTVIDGRYEIEALIGRGGMGTVWRARHVFTNGRVALKMLTDTLDADAGHRFLAEARAAATISHPAIVVVGDANRTPDGQLYLVMELLAGKPLRMAMTGAMPGDHIVRIGLELLDALATAHTRGVVHRDLKPENVFLVAPTGAVKILDFGIAKVVGAGTTAHGHMLGTLEYMAPEQLYDSAQVDGRADLWAVGVILYEMIAGMRPLGGANREERYRALAADEPMPIGEVVPVTPEVSTFFAQALARDREKRFASATQMSAALRRLSFTPKQAGGAGGVPWLTLGTGPARADPAPGPTMGTGAGWAPRSDAPPGPTMGTGAGWHRPASVPPPDGAGLPGAVPPHVPAPAAGKRSPVLLALGLVVVAGAIAFAVVMATRASSRGDALGPADAKLPDATVIVKTPADAPASDVTAGSCASHCERLAACELAAPSCMVDCNDTNNRECLDGAKTCDELAACYWTRRCGRPINHAGMNCLDGLTCYARMGGQDTSLQCSNCFDLLAPDAATKLARFEVCRTVLQHHQTEAHKAKRDFDGTKWFADHCQVLSNRCTGAK